MRIPDWLFAYVTRIYRTQRAIREREQRAEVTRQDRAAREHYDTLRASHEAGTCGGALHNCPYYPCYDNSMRPW